MNIYFHSGTLLKQIEIRGLDTVFMGIDCLIVDEIHEQNVDTIILLTLIKLLFDQNRLNTKIILMSATLDANQFSQYFGNCPEIQIDGHRIYDITINYLEDILPMINYSTDNFINHIGTDNIHTLSSDLLIDAYYRTCPSYNNIDYELVYKLIDYIDRKYPKEREILVFFPGYKQITTQLSILTEDENKNKFNIIILHSKMEGEEEDLVDDDNEKIFSEHNPNKRNIILATNIAETSLTIPNVVGTILQRCYFLYFDQFIIIFFLIKRDS